MGMLGGRSRGGISPLTLALIGTLAYRTIKGKGRLADLLGTSGGQGNTSPTGPSITNASPFGSLISPASISDGLTNLLNRFRANGHAEKAESWIASGTNKTIASPELGEALGEERVSWLMEQTGMSREDLLAGLSNTLPDAVDQLTPDGHIPSETEAKRLL